jgi:hypothetical protein
VEGVSKVAAGGHFDQDTPRETGEEEVVEASKSDTGDAFDQAPLDTKDTTPDTTEVDTGEEEVSKAVVDDAFDQAPLDTTPDTTEVNTGETRETGEEEVSKCALEGTFDQAPLDTTPDTTEVDASLDTRETEEEVVSKSADLGSFDPAALPTTREAEVDTGEATSEASSEAAIRCTLRCKHCGQEFVPKAAMRPVGYRRGGQQVYCSPGCRAKAANEGRKEKRIAAKAALRKAAREAAREVTRETATCKHCGQEFVRVRRRGRLQVYCSPGCTKTGQASEAKKKARKAGL